MKKPLTEAKAALASAITVFALCAMVAGCETFKAAFQNMTPAQKAKYSINAVYVIANEAITLAGIFIQNEEDVDKIRSKVNEVVAQVSSTVAVILALIPPGMDEVGTYAQERMDTLNRRAESLSSAVESNVDTAFLHILEDPTPEMEELVIQVGEG